MSEQPNSQTPDNQTIAAGLVKWFDPERGFGFIIDDSSGPDILLHANVLRDFGQSAVSEGTHLRVLAIPTERGIQAVQVLEITPPSGNISAPIPELAKFSPAALAAIDLQAARVKWFDRQKGFGFANLFGQAGDVFLHAEVLRRSGFADLISGEAIALRVIAGQRGLIAAEVVAWDRASQLIGDAGCKNDMAG